MKRLHNKINKEELKQKMLESKVERTTLSFYKYALIKDVEKFRNELYKTLDAVEVYGIDRKTIEHWLPVSLRQFAASLSIAGSGDEIVAAKNYNQEFRLCLVALTNLLTLLGSFKPNKIEETFLKQLVQDMSLEYDSKIDCGVYSLIASFKPDENFRLIMKDGVIFRNTLGH